LKLWRGTRRRR